jgi:hypothetical protein
VEISRRLLIPLKKVFHILQIISHCYYFYFFLLVLFKQIPDDSVVIAGHGENTTIKKEKKYNAILYENDI